MKDLEIIDLKNMTDHKHKWKYHFMPSKTGKTGVIYRDCLDKNCGIHELHVVVMDEWRKCKSQKPKV